MQHNDGTRPARIAARFAFQLNPGDAEDIDRLVVELSRRSGYGWTRADAVREAIGHLADALTAARQAAT